MVFKIFKHRQDRNALYAYCGKVTNKWYLNYTVLRRLSKTKPSLAKSGQRTKWQHHHDHFQDIAAVLLQCFLQMPTHTCTHTQAFYGQARWDGTRKKHSLTHTYCGHQSSVAHTSIWPLISAPEMPPHFPFIWARSHFHPTYRYYFACNCCTISLLLSMMYRYLYW